MHETSEPDHRKRRRSSGKSSTIGASRGRSSDGRRRSAKRSESPATGIAARSSIVLPPITYPDELPVSAHREEIARAISENQVVIVSGETGSGKTTQLPKIALELGRGRAGQIGHTQPRRIAAHTVAERLAEELGTELGGAVGYQVRFTDHSSDQTLVRVMTDGILLNQIQNDPMLWGYDTLIIDEAHERSLNIDFLLGYLRTLLPKRPDLKLIITSATIDSERFATHFGSEARPAPVIEVSGRTYPVQLRYRPLDEGADPIDQPTGIVRAARELMTEGPGDILVFCSGERDIRDAADALVHELRATLVGKGTARSLPGQIEIMPLYSRLSAAEQHRVFENHAARRIVLATNVAETSLTVPGIRYVIDPGTARISRYSKATKVQRLPIEPISQASANQRAGRCGRVAPGIAIRLYSEEDFDTRPQFNEPEILRTSLASVILQMISVGVVTSPQDIGSFPFVDRPDSRNIRDGVNLLTELGAIGKDPTRNRTELTPVGRMIAQMPVDPRLARMICEADRYCAVREVVIVAAALSIQDPRERPEENQAQADQLHARFRDTRSDFLTFLNLWEYLHRKRQELSNSAFRRFCRSEYLNFLRIREWQDLVTQLKQVSRNIGLAWNSVAPTAKPGGGTHDAARLTWNPEPIHRSMIPGLLSQMGMALRADEQANRQKKSRTGQARRSLTEYLGARGARFAIFPGSALAKKPPAWLMSAQLMETSRLWALNSAEIVPEWIEKPAEHLTKTSYSDPHWSAKRQAGIVNEKVLLYGLPIITSRAVPLARIDPQAAREMFIRQALIEGEWHTSHAFWDHNTELIELADAMATRRRSRGVDPEELFDFYDERIPDDVTSGKTFDSWWRRQREVTPDLLDLTPQDVGITDSDEDRDGFPDSWFQAGMTFPLSYTYLPGEAADGVSVHLPVQALLRIRDEGFDWQIPGLRTELIAALIKTLPKAQRVHLVPAPDTARQFAPHLADPAQWADGDGHLPRFTQVLATLARRERGVMIPDDAWDPDRLPAHLRIEFIVENEDESVVASGHHLAELQRRLAPKLTGQRIGSLMGEHHEAQGRSSVTEAGRGSGGEELDVPTIYRPWGIERTGVQEWDGDPLPERLERSGAAGGTEIGFPALVAEIAESSGDAGPVSIQVLASQARAQRVHAEAIAELALRKLALSTARITSRLRPEDALALATSHYHSVDSLVLDAQRIVLRSMIPTPAPRDPAGYEAFVGNARDRLEPEANSVIDSTVGLLRGLTQVDSLITAQTSLAVLSSVADARSHLDSLFGHGFLLRSGTGHLGDLKRYLEAERVRMERLASHAKADAAGIWEIDQAKQELDSAIAALPVGADPWPLKQIRWMIEEYRISVFAQGMRTVFPVSLKRIRRAIADADRAS